MLIHSPSANEVLGFKNACTYRTVRRHNHRDPTLDATYVVLSGSPHDAVSICLVNQKAQAVVHG